MLYLYSIISSTPFKFLIGPDSKLFTVHAALVAYHSKPLGVLTNGPMSEAKEGCAFLEDVEESTFVRFSQYAYTGDYTAADPDIVLDSSMIAATSAIANDATLSQENFKVTVQSLAPEQFDELSLVAVEPSNASWDSWDAPKKDKKQSKKAQIFSYGDEPETHISPSK